MNLGMLILASLITQAAGAALLEGDVHTLLYSLHLRAPDAAARGDVSSLVHEFSFVPLLVLAMLVSLLPNVAIVIATGLG